jgi:hypothetical protein
MITSGSIIKRKNKKGYVWQITIELPKDPVTGKRVRQYKTVGGTKKEAEAAVGAVPDEGLSAEEYVKKSLKFLL